MAEITTIYVWDLKTEPGKHTGTDDHVYVGVYGTGGGREFALDVDGFDDFEPGSVNDYEFGKQTLGRGRKPTTAAAQLNHISISLQDVTHVYLRKQGDRTHTGDDFWEVSKCNVLLTSSINNSRMFSLEDTARLGNEYGHKVWLYEGDEEVHTQMLREAGIKPEAEQE